MLWADITERTQAECKQDILTMLDSIGFTATSWQEGSVALGCVEIGALCWSKFTEVAVALKEAHTLQDASGAALEAYAASQYDETRTAATAAQYLVRLDCEAGEGPHSLDVGDVIVTDGEYTYRNIEGNSITYPYNLAGGANVTLLFEAETPGADPTVAASTIDTLQTTYAGVTVNTGGNSLVTSGLDQETEDRYKERCRTKWATLTEGETIADGVVNICLNANDTIARVAVDDANPRGDYTFDAYLASDTGTVSAGVVSDAQDALDLRFFGSSTALAIASAADTLAITGTVYYDPNLTAGDAQTAVEAALTAWFQTIPIGGFNYGVGLTNVVTVEDVRGAIRSAQINGSDVVRTLVLTAPAADHTVTNYDVVTQGALTITYTAAAT